MERIAIKRIKLLERDDMEQVMKSNTPCIVSGAINHWPAVKKWSLAYFKKKIGHLKFIAEYGMPTGKEPIQFKLSEFQRQISLNDFIDVITEPEEGKSYYIANKSIDRFESLTSDVLFDELTSYPSNDSMTKVWLGSKNTKSSLHTDPYTNVLAQIHGSKKVFLVDPKDTKNLSVYESHIDKSRVDPEAPDFEKFPLLQEVTIYTGTLEEGDCLYIPKLWWHTVRSLDASISVNFFFGPRIGISDILPIFIAGGYKVWVRFIKDFFVYGLFRRKYERPLYAAEPLGVWFYIQMIEFFKKRLSNS